MTNLILRKNMRNKSIPNGKLDPIFVTRKNV